MAGSVRPDLNITPLIDVLLVLIVIFMAALPLTQKAIEADVPAQVQSPITSTGTAQIVVEYGADGHLAINHQDVSLEGLGASLRGIYATRTDKTIFVLGAPSLPYRSIVAVLDAARGAGVDRVGIITEGMRAGAR